MALKDAYFIERKLYPNVDFYCGHHLRAIGIPTNMFTVMFAMGRCPAGSPTGRRCARAARRRSPDPARCTPGRRCRTTWRSSSGSGEAGWGVGFSGLLLSPNMRLQKVDSCGSLREPKV